MGGFSFDDFKRKAQDVFSTVTEKTVEMSQKTSDYVKEKIPEVTEKVKTTINENVPKIETFVNETIDTFKTKTSEYAETLNDNKTMTHKVLMLGGRRAGKSTILASILHVLKNETPGSLCTINDLTDYTQKIVDKNQQVLPLPTLDGKRLEVSNYMKRHQENSIFQVDMSPNFGKSSYILRVSSSQANIDFEFVDVPGEWMRKNVPEHNELKLQVMTSDVFVIAIDTPFLMQDDDDINMVYNRIDEITDVIANISIDPNVEEDRRLIILSPVKCEKWLQSGRADEVNKKVKHAYRNLINKWIQFKNVDIWIMPIQTVGGLESVRLMPALVYFKDEKDRKLGGTSCSLDETSGLLIDKDGNTIDPDEVEVENDLRWEIDYTPIPLSWYRKNKLGFSPIDCEQPGYHILRFLVNKEEQVVIKKAEYEKNIQKEVDNMSWLEKLMNLKKWMQTWNPSFGQYLPLWKDVIVEMSNRGLIKEHGDGFEHVTQVVE